MEGAAGVLVLDREFEAVDPTGDHVALEEELRDVERVDDVRALEVQVDRAADR
jgi:hypothetical protein